MKKSILLLIFMLCISLFCSCGEAEIAETTEITTPGLPVVAVELPKIYDLPVKEGLLVQNWLLEGLPDLIITDQLPENIIVPVILVGSADTDNDLVYTIDYAWDQLAETQVSLLAQLPYQGDLNRDGLVTYAILAPTGTDYKAACTLAMGKHQLVSTQACLDDQEVARQVATRILSSYGKDLDVLLCGSEALSRGASAAAKDLGRVIDQDLILLTVGQDIPRTSGTVYADPQAMIDTILALVENPADTIIPLTAITQ